MDTVDPDICLAMVEELGGGDMSLEGLKVYASAATNFSGERVIEILKAIAERQHRETDLPGARKSEMLTIRVRVEPGGRQFLEDNERLKTALEKLEKAPDAIERMKKAIKDRFVKWEITDNSTPQRSNISARKDTLATKRIIVDGLPTVAHWFQLYQEIEKLDFGTSGS